MCWLGLITFCVVTVTSVIAQERENGILYDHTTKGLRPWYEAVDMKNHGFPNSAPHNLVQTWRYVGLQQPGEYTAIQIICNKISIAKRPADNTDCGEFRLTVQNKGKNQEFCGDIGQLSILSETNDITFELRTGPNGGGIVDCTAQAVPVTSDRSVITTTTTSTTTTPPPTRPAYMNQESHEVDSSEHGGEEGKKSTTCPCGWANKVSARIVNGTETAKNEFPFAVGLVYRGSRARFCGATIISRYHALTAAHCTEKKTAVDLSIIVGAHNIYEDFDGPAEEIPIERVVNHPEFNRDVWRYDIALLILEREIKFNQFVGPACLPLPSPKLDLDRQYIKIIGWGAGMTNGAQSPVLRKVDVRVVPMKECNHMYPIVNVEMPSQICTYSKEKASCQGDSGGPVMWVDPETNRYTHVGIVSFGRICGDISPSVHTNVQAYLDWIQHYIRASNKPNSQTCTKVV